MKAGGLDVRTKLILLLYTAIVVFAVPKLWLEVTMFALCSLLHIIYGSVRRSLKYLVIYAAAVAVQFFLLPKLSGAALMTVSIFAVSFRRLMPCIMAGRLLLQTTTASEMLNGLQKLHIPIEVTIPLAVTVRYIPAVKEQLQHIRDARRLRQFSKRGGFLHRAVRSMELYYVPLLVSAVQMSDEITAAAVTRGIEDPCRHTSALERRFGTADYLLLTLLAALTALIIFTRKAAVA
ncbi:cobalt transport protein [Ruminococcus albus 8]|uniref:Cobalt transport protein n=1 Tax=Ruminococcus albus 8 TaxID=246199 RepID=E9SE30_RUMAL|nr:energy-coupling factor transporter transmembrane component T [Ruminococcus albus]EGC02501.1 cobalt transport protein [Ruminococcus albus 8]